jgi:glutamate dehydrogenase (NAD(P)+)
MIGPHQDIPAPDVNSNSQIMAWMMDTYSMNAGMTTTGVVTGKPIHLGGSLGRVKATGHGVYVTGREVAQFIALELRGARVAIQGFGNVGATAAELFSQAGCKVVAVQDQFDTVFNADGLPVDELLRLQSAGQRLCDANNVQTLPTEEFWDVSCEILIPAALESQLTPARAMRTSAKLILEGANGPTLPTADDILNERGITVVPDVICNSGGVIVSYFEWVQDFSSYFWSEAEVNQRLERIIIDALRVIWEVAAQKRISLRTAAFVVACERILMARQERGLYP